MRIFPKLAILLSLVIVAACGREIETTSPFNASEVAYINQRGAATISGQAFLRQRGGGVVTCAATNVQLIPAGQFAKERMSQIYGSVNGGRITVLQGVSQKNVPPQYLSMVRVAPCDAEGDFSFSRVANGDYYLVAAVTWYAGDAIIPEGGSIAKLIQVRGGRSQRFILN